MSEGFQKIETKSAVATLQPAYVLLRMKNGAVDDLPAAIENVKAVTTLAHRKSLPLLVDTRPLKSQDKAARDYYQGTMLIRVVTATAVITDSILGSVLGNYFANKDAIIPFKIFRAEGPAIEWLKSLPAGSRSESTG